MAKEYKYKIDKSFIDFNGHLAEFGYYYYGVEGLRKLCEDRGCSPELYKELKIGPITFQTTVSFKKEVRENSVIVVNPRITAISENCKKWSKRRLRHIGTSQIGNSVTTSNHMSTDRSGASAIIW